jgi:hypothetical protein
MDKWQNVNIAVRSQTVICLFLMSVIILGQRSVESLAEHVRSQLQTSVVDVKSVDELNTKIDDKKRKVVAFFAQKAGPAFDNLQKVCFQNYSATILFQVSSNLRDDCQFLFGDGQGFEEQTRNGPHIYFRDKNAGSFF